MAESAPPEPYSHEDCIHRQCPNPHLCTEHADGCVMERARDRPKDGDWPEDFSHENGNYQCKCCQCDQLFIGHKRRVVCRKCAHPDTSPICNTEKEKS